MSKRIKIIIKTEMHKVLICYVTVTVLDTPWYKTIMYQVVGTYCFYYTPFVRIL